jgi:hypothetical protein
MAASVGKSQMPDPDISGLNNLSQSDSERRSYEIDAPRIERADCRFEMAGRTAGRAGLAAPVRVHETGLVGRASGNTTLDESARSKFLVMRI